MQTDAFLPPERIGEYKPRFIFSINSRFNCESINLDLADVCAFEQYSALVHSGQFLLKNYDSNFVLGMLMNSNEIVGYITESELGRVGPISREVEKLVNELLKDYDKLKNLLNDIQKEISLLD